MSHKCTKCGKIHDRTVKYLSKKGCDTCGSKSFFFVKREWFGEKEGDCGLIGDEAAVSLELEAIKATRPGTYEFDLNKLFQQKPLVIQTAPGKYKIDFSTLKPQRKNGRQ